MTHAIWIETNKKYTIMKEKPLFYEHFYMEFFHYPKKRNVSLVTHGMTYKKKKKIEITCCNWFQPSKETEYRFPHEFCYEFYLILNTCIKYAFNYAYFYAMFGRNGREKK